MPHPPDFLDRALDWLKPADYASNNRIIDIDTGHIDVCCICHAPLNEPSDFEQDLDLKTLDIVCTSSYLVKCGQCGHSIHDDCERLYLDGLQSRKPCPYCKTPNFYERSTIVQDFALSDLIALVHALLDIVIVDLIIASVVEDAVAEFRTKNVDAAMLEDLASSVINDVVAEMAASVCADPSIQSVKLKTDEYTTWLARRAFTTKRHRTKNGCTGWKRRSAKFKGIKFTPCISP